MICGVRQAEAAELIEEAPHRPLSAEEKASLYLAGFWEGETGWTRVDPICIADLEAWKVPKVYRVWERYTAHLEKSHPLEATAEMIALVKKWGARTHTRFKPDPYLRFLLAERPRLTAYRHDGRLVGVEFNIRYANVCATHLFAWERDELSRTNLGKYCLAFEAIRCRDEGCRYFAMGKIYPYKQFVFRTGLI